MVNLSFWKDTVNLKQRFPQNWLFVCCLLTMFLYTSTAPHLAAQPTPVPLQKAVELNKQDSNISKTMNMVSQ